MKSKQTLLNVYSSFLSQFVSIISGFIVPRIILSCFGSSLNGLTASIGQFLGYICLVEGGITGVVAANLYKPIIENDTEKISSIITTARKFYRKIGSIFSLYALIIAFVYPIVVNTGYDYFYVVLLTLIMAIGLLLEYMFSIVLTTLLTTGKRVYVISFTKICLTLGNLGLVLIITKYFPNLLLLKFVSGILFIIQPLAYSFFIKKYFKIDWKAPVDNKLIKERWNGFAVNFAAFIHVSTDATVLTFFCDLKIVSVYSIYFLIINKLEMLIHSIAAGIEPTIGQAYAGGNLEELNQKMDLFEYVIFCLVGILFSILGMLITPFVSIYTQGINDVNYYRPMLGALLTFSEAIYLVRYPHICLSYSANKFKEITVAAYIEAGINILISIIGVNFWGVEGVALGTVIAMLFRMVFQIHLSTKLINNRKQIVFYKKFFLVSLISAIGILLGINIYPFRTYEIGSWVLHGVVYTFLFIILYIIMSFVFFKNEISYLKKYISRR